jgi:uncharacterized protein YqeY
MNIKQQIVNQLTTAIKAKNQPLVMSIRNILTKITNAEKNNSNNELTDEELINLFIKLDKEINKSITAYKEGNRLDLLEKEELELSIILEFLPKKLSEEEIKDIIHNYAEDLLIDDSKALNNMIVKHFNMHYKGQFDNKELITLLNNFIK